SRPNMRWCSDVLEFTCWIGDVVRVAFARTAMIARSSAGRQRQLKSPALRAPHSVQWPRDNGSIFAANRTLEIAAALNLEPCFNQWKAPRATAWAEAFVKTFKHPDQSASRRSNRALMDRSLDGGLQLNTRIPGWAVAHRESTFHHFNKPRV